MPTASFQPSGGVDCRFYQADHPAGGETAKCPEPLCPTLALPPLGRCAPSPRKALPFRPRSYGLMRPSVRLSPPSAIRLVRRVFAGCCQPLLPPGCSRRYLCESFLRCLIPYPGGPTQCVYLLLPVCHRPSPLVNRVGFPLPRQNDFPGGSCFEAADISLCSGLPVCSPPRSFLPLLAQGSRGFYFRAEHASLPPHASDMLAIRIQAIDGVGTCTPPDSQPCRLLLTKHDRPGRKNPGCPAAVCAAVGTIWGVSKLGGIASG